MASIEVDIDIQDYLDEVRSKYLVRELNRRGYNIQNINDKEGGVEIEEDFCIPNFKTPQEVLRFLKKVMGLREFHDNERLLNEIKALF